MDGKRRVLHAGGKLPARDAGLSDLEDGAADRPALAHDRSRHVHSGHREVLAEVAVFELPPDLSLPPVQVLPRVGIDGFVGPAVHFAVGLVVSGNVDAVHGHAPFDRGFPDRRRLPPPEPIDLARRANVDGKQRPAHEKGARSLLKPGWDSTRAIQAAIAGRPDISRTSW